MKQICTDAPQDETSKLRQQVAALETQVKHLTEQLQHASERQESLYNAYKKMETTLYLQQVELQRKDQAQKNEEEERRQIETTLRQYEHIVSATPDSISLVDSNYIYRVVNNAYIKRTARHYHDIVGHPVDEVLGQDVFAELIQERLDRCLQGETIHYRAWFDYPTQGLRFMDVTYAPYRDEYGTITGVLVSSRDITDFKQVEEDLCEQEELYRSLVATIPDMIFVHKQGKVVFINQAGVCLLRGTSPDDFVGKSVVDFFLPERVEPMKAQLAEALESSELPILTEHVVCLDGTILAIEGKGKHVTFQGEPAILNVALDVTERKQMEQALHESEKLLRSIAANYPRSYISIIELDMTIGFTSGQEFAKQNLNPEDFVGMTLAQVFGDQAEIVREYYLQTFQGNETCFELHINNQQQLYKTVPLYDIAGNISRILVVVENISERMRIEQALRESEERYRVVSELVPDYAYSFGVEEDNTLILEWITEAFHQITEFTVKELDERGGWASLIYPDDMPIALQRSQRLFQGQTDVSEFRIVTKSGKVRWLCDHGRGIWDDNLGRIIRIYSAAQDITERKHAEQALRESEQKFRSFIEQSKEGIVIVDQDGYIIEWNKEAEHIIGVPREKSIGRPIWDVQFEMTIPQNRKPQVYERVKDLVLSALHTDFVPQQIITSRIVRPDKIERIIQSSVFLIQTEKGKLIGSIIHDVTEEKETEETLKRAREAAEVANQAKSEFLATMSHEIRTPINAMTGMTTLLLNTDLTVEQRDYVQTIRMSNDSLLGLINDILDFSKIETGKLAFEYHPFNLRDCIEDSFDLLASKASEKGLELSYWIEEQVPIDVIGDVTRVRQVLVNLLSNGVKFTEQGEVVVTVSVEDRGAMTGVRDADSLTEPHTKPHTIVSSTDDPHTEPRTVVSGTEVGDGDSVTLCISVRDTGIGIPTDRFDSLFQLFSQLDTSTTREYGGTGLGLAITKRLVEMMGGKVSVDSEVGKGTTFHVNFMAKVAPSQQYTFANPDQPHLQSKRLLIVSDQPTTKDILTRYTTQWGMRGESSETFDEALSLIQQGKPFDVILLDIHETESKNPQPVKQIQQAWQGKPLILYCPISSLKTFGNRAAFQDMVVLFKPVRPEPLHTALVHIATQPIKQTTIITKQGDTLDPEMGVRHPLRILVAEDNVVNQKVAKRLLEKLGYRADLAANGREAFVSVQRNTYDVVLMDVEMPEMDGIEATKRIRLLPSQQHQPSIIAMTAHALEETREMCLSAGMDGYVSKPVRVKELIVALQRVQPTTESKIILFHDVADVATDSSGQSEEPDQTQEPDDGSQIESSFIDETLYTRFAESMGSSIASQLVDIFVADGAEKVTLLQQAIAEQDTKACVHLGHAFKSSSAQLGAMQLADLCKQLEQQGREDISQGMQELVQQIAEVFEQTRNELLKKISSTL